MQASILRATRKVGVAWFNPRVLCDTFTHVADRSRQHSRRKLYVCVIGCPELTCTLHCGSVSWTTSMLCYRVVSLMLLPEKGTTRESTGSISAEGSRAT